jgi:Zn-dependent protease
VFAGLFNVLPFPPLDGLAVVSVMFPDRYARPMRELASNGMSSMIGLLVAWRIFPFFTDPLLTLLLKLIHPTESYG